MRTINPIASPTSQMTSSIAQEVEMYYGGPATLGMATVPPSNDTTQYTGGPHNFLGNYILGQGFEPTAFDQERMVVNREWICRCMCAYRRDSASH
jgi:hypothetical protein